MHRERRKDIAIILLAGAFSVILSYVFVGWFGVVLILMIVAISIPFLPPSDVYVKCDLILAKILAGIERPPKVEGVQTTISEYVSEEEESNET